MHMAHYSVEICIAVELVLWYQVLVCRRELVAVIFHGMFQCARVPGFRTFRHISSMPEH